MGACKSTNNNSKRRVVVGPATPSGSDEYGNIRKRFQNELKRYPFINLGSSLQDKLCNEYKHSKLSPHEFINEKFSSNTLFKRLYMLAYLKCSPIINVVMGDNAKSSNLFFFEISMFMLSNAPAPERKKDLAKNIIMEAFDINKGKHNLKNLRECIRTFVNVAMIIMIYFGMIFIFIEDEEKQRVFEAGDTNIKIDNHYDMSELDNFFFDKFSQNIHKEMNENFILNIWEYFLIVPLGLLSEGGGEVQLKPNELYKVLSDSTKEEIQLRVMHMFDPNVFFEVFVKKKIPSFKLEKYKNSLK